MTLRVASGGRAPIPPVQGGDRQWPVFFVARDEGARCHDDRAGTPQRAGGALALIVLRARVMTELIGLLRDLFLIFLAAKVAAELFERIHQPPVIGELLAGVLIGPYALGLDRHPGRRT